MPKPRNIVWISKTARDVMISEGRQRFPNETGGIIMGYWAESFEEAVVTSVIGPGPRSERSTTSFTPDHEYQLKELRRRYLGSDRLHTYLGDWHTHPEGGSYLSRTDRRTLRVIAEHREARIARPLMIVLGGGGFTEIRAWRFRRHILSPFTNRELELKIQFY